jgi:tRNA A37 methylthiotransferase MiaB
VDGHHFPNLALMKLAACHRQNGDTVEWVNHLERYDKVYQSKVFTFMPDVSVCVQADETVKEGTGYKMYDELFCDDTEPDYSIYPQYPHAYGFLTRGCVRHCPWCIVPKKEGNIRAYRDIETVLQGRKTAILMDNNVLASDFGLQQLEKIIDLKCKVDFNQGLDSRLVTDEIAKLLSKIKWIRFLRFSCDTTPAVEPLLRAIEKLNRYGVKNYRIFVYRL